jgi:hypothetical protein
MSDLTRGFEQKQASMHSDAAKRWFRKLIQPEQYVGEVYSISYETALVQIHDYYRKKVGGIPSLSFLIATRINPEEESIDYQLEDNSVILLRVIDSAALPNSAEAERIRVESAQEVSGEIEAHWDNQQTMDPQTHNLLSFAGVSCRVIGTFFLDRDPQNPDQSLAPRFGSDLSNFYPNRGLKVFKPNGAALAEIVNYQDPNILLEQVSKKRVVIGEVRYASTNRAFQGVSNVEVSISPADLLTQKTALFGMTRTGKSNTTKIIAKSVFELRYESESPLRIGQLIFDPNGEYANENAQDNNGALKNVWQTRTGTNRDDELVTYGIMRHPNDPERILMLLNFYEDENLQIGKEIIDNLLSEDDVTYIKNFIQIAFDPPDPADHSAMTRFNRRVLAYRSVLSRAGFEAPQNLQASTRRLFNQDLINAMEESQSDDAPEYLSAARVFNNPNPSWGQLANAFEALDKFIRDKRSGYTAFENEYVTRPDGSGDRWADEDLKKIIGLFQYPNGTRKIGQAAVQHSAQTEHDYAEDIYNHLVDGKLVIVDQSTGGPDLNNSSAQRIMSKIFRENQRKFIEGVPDIPEVLVYVEEAHNLLPPGSEQDTRNVWVQTAKEGAKYHIGMVYVTQEVSSVQKNILKNTANWFIGHLNNTDETRELRKFYDFGDFENSIIRAQDRGFLRVKTLSNLFVVPVQITRFEV